VFRRDSLAAVMAATSSRSYPWSLHGDPANEYFSAGFSEGNSNCCSRQNSRDFKDLFGRKARRFYFKGQVDRMRTIGEKKLGVTNLLEGQGGAAKPGATPCAHRCRTNQGPADGRALWSKKNIRPRVEGCLRRSRREECHRGKQKQLKVKV